MRLKRLTPRSCREFRAPDDQHAFHYDAKGSLIRTLYPDGTEIWTAYDDMGRAAWTTYRYRTTTTIDPNTGAITNDNATKALATFTTYDAVKRVVPSSPAEQQLARRQFDQLDFGKRLSLELIGMRLVPGFDQVIQVGGKYCLQAFPSALHLVRSISLRVNWSHPTAVPVFAACASAREEIPDRRAFAPGGFDELTLPVAAVLSTAGYEDQPIRFPGTSKARRGRPGGDADASLVRCPGVSIGSTLRISRSSQTYSASLSRSTASAKSAIAGVEKRCAVASRRHQSPIFVEDRQRPCGVPRVPAVADKL